MNYCWNNDNVNLLLTKRVALLFFKKGKSRKSYICTQQNKYRYTPSPSPTLSFVITFASCIYLLTLPSSSSRLPIWSGSACLLSQYGCCHQMPLVKRNHLLVDSTPVGSKRSSGSVHSEQLHQTYIHSKQISFYSKRWTKNYNAHKVFPQKRPGGDLSRSSNTVF